MRVLMISIFAFVALCSGCAGKIDFEKSPVRDGCADRIEFERLPTAFAPRVKCTDNNDCTSEWVEIPSVYKGKISDLEIYIIPLGEFAPPIDKLIPQNSDDKAFIAQMAQSLPKNFQNVMLLKHKDFTALIDTGFPHTADILALQLMRLGITNITHLIITHAHIDHIGGILGDENAVFKMSAKDVTMLIDKNEYDFWLNSDNERVKSALLAFKDRVAFFSDDNLLNKSLGLGENSDLEIESIPAYGHTAGHTMIKIARGGQKLVFIADLMHIFDIQMARPHIAIQYDSNPSEAIKARIKFLDLFKDDSNTQIIGSHLPFGEPRILE